MKRLSGSICSRRVQCVTLAARSLCRTLMAPMPTMISKSALTSLNSPIRIRTNDDSLGACLEAAFLDVLRGAAARATISWYLLNYSQHAPSPLDHGAVDCPRLGHAVRGYELVRVPAAPLDPEAA